MCTKRALIVLLSALSISCATDFANRDYESTAFSRRHGDQYSPYRDGSPQLEDINGFMPASVFIKSRTQTFCRDYQFCVVDGRIYYKGAKSRSAADWRLFVGTGLPHSKKWGFRPARRIVEIAADSDELYALSDEGRIYQVFLSEALNYRAFSWIDRLGWPDKTPLVLNDLVARNRAWSVGTRNAQVLWHEDSAGNQHHFGTTGITTIYYLSEDGREIRFTDTGLPSDFSHGILGPERGSFVAESLSASASTMFVIDDAGRMYTRLADFDTLGYDPMFFKYTYSPRKDDTPGSDYWTTSTPWALPSEDWREQPAIALSGLGAISSRISILQNGYGNAARELRVAGLSPDGEAGYYYKDIFEEEWRFARAALVLDARDFLEPARVASGRGSRGPRLEAAMSGSLWVDDREDEGLEFSIPDFSIREGSCRLEVRSGDELATLDLFPVDMWTYMKRYDPGMDGTPKLLYVTVRVPEGALDGASPRFRERVEGLFGPIDRKAFACRAEATERYLHLELPPSGERRSFLFLTAGGSGGVDRELLRRLSLVWTKRVDRYLAEDLVLRVDSSLGVADRTAIESAIEGNLKYREDVEAELRLYRSYMKSAQLSRWSYSVFDFVTAVTFLKNVDVPRIKTLTTHGREIMDANADIYRLMADSKEWTYSKLLELLDARIAEYRRLLEAFDSGAHRAEVRPGYRETFAGYFDAVGLPQAMAGLSPSTGGRAASLYRLSSTPLFPGLVLDVEAPGPGEPGVKAAALVELLDVARRVIERRGDDLAVEPFTAEVRLHFVLDGDRDGKRALEDVAGTLSWDGSVCRIWTRASPLKRELLFEGTAGLAMGSADRDASEASRLPRSAAGSTT